tara:strand:+ start:87 stop:356 length:270 start_codon:yes stop_codon:yes gene_type:complete
MLTVKLLRDTETYIYQTEEVTILDKERGKEDMKAHIAECVVKSANVGVENCHSDMKAIIFAGSHTSYLYPSDKAYITSDSGKTIHSMVY